MYRLDDVHLEKAKEIAARNRKKKQCNACYDRGYIGVTEENMLYLCHKCVDVEKVMQDWKEYVAKFPELKEFFKELFEDDKKNQENEDKGDS
jgi:hypothetical protein